MHGADSLSEATVDRFTTFDVAQKDEHDPFVVLLSIDSKFAYVHGCRVQGSDFLFIFLCIGSVGLIS